MIEQVRLGKTDINVSKLSFGAAPLGGAYGDFTQKDADTAVRTALDYGITTFDTSPYRMALRPPDGPLAFFAGPLGDRGSISGITTENLTVGHLFAGAFDAMAENYQQLVRRLCPQRDWSRIVLSGGLVQRIEQLREGIIRRLSERPGPDADRTTDADADSSNRLDAARGQVEYRLALNAEETLTGLGQLYGGAAGFAG